ncbi:MULTISPECIES: taurine ABC transporter substrate-binding protein [Agrobacterium]|uniref:Taurine transport system substrate-binding protein n=1 Tax=Agrobacterium larrymoorei TaxID=160699 RepID=A0AAJ2BGV2_9HYPH|nr:taurine ABC transporter substrate-binding protein [Agrobacterium larrymoorei]MDQ1187258.1 taurine transport system substrate-binding protein [Agrobacterium larrymoorei]MDQ1196930.1 taurine transport system substrate-binding protein [Rhizobium sp. SORGH_AS_0787]MDR6103548.1 taurine transport system substrate-binding protein [Agrobacterium larrymoorei]
MNRLSKAFVSFAATCSAVFGLSFGALAQDKTVTFAYQDMMTPIRVLMESGKLESETGYKIKWVKFGGGGDVIRAMSSGDVDIGEAGSSPIAAAASQGLPIKLFWILDDIANAEQLVVRKDSGIKTIADLKGKTIAVPFVSTSHYQLMYALSEAGLTTRDVKLLNMRPPEIAAAWERGDLDATFIWAPVLDVAKKNGTVIASAGDFAAKGKATFDGLVVTDKFADANKEFVTTFVKLLAAADADYAANKAAWTQDSKPVAAVAKWTGANPADVPAAMAAYKFPTLEQQGSSEWLGGGAAKALQSTAEFLKEQGRVTDIAPDYSAFVTDEYVKAVK